MHRSTATRSRCPSAGSRSATPRTSPPASRRRSSTSTATSSLWRDEAGELHVQDAFCPHLGAHLGHGGTVEGCEIVCPFHGWRFDAEGANTDIPYSERTNKKGTLRTYPVVERNGLSHGLVPPRRRRWRRSGRSDELPEFNGDPEWSTVIRTDAHRRRAAGRRWPRTASTPRTSASCTTPTTVPEIESYETGVPRLADAVAARSSPRPAAWSRGASTPSSSGPGFAHRPLQRHRRHAEPRGAPRRSTAEQCITRFNFRVQDDRRRGDHLATSARRSCDEVDQQVLEDKPIWEHKAHLVRPGPGRHRRPVHEVPQVGRPVLRRGRSATSASCSRRRGGPTGSTRPRPRPPPAPGTATELTVLVDPAIWPWRDRRWSHLVSDESYEELHAFAERARHPAPRLPGRPLRRAGATTGSAPSSWARAGDHPGAGPPAHRLRAAAAQAAARVHPGCRAREDHRRDDTPSPRLGTRLAGQAGPGRAPTWIQGPTGTYRPPAGDVGPATDDQRPWSDAGGGSRITVTPSSTHPARQQGLRHRQPLRPGDPWRCGSRGIDVYPKYGDIPFDPARVMLNQLPCGTTSTTTTPSTSARSSSAP